MGIKGWRRLNLGVLKMVLSGARYAVSSFFIHYAARVANLNSLAQPINIIVLHSFVCYSRKPFLTEGLIRLDTDQTIKKRLMSTSQ